MRPLGSALRRGACRARRTGRTSTLESANALRATQLIFASYLSSRQGGRVDLPLPAEGRELALADFFPARG